MTRPMTLLCGAWLMLTSSCNLEAQNNYTVAYQAGAAADKTMAYLTDWDTVETLDSAIVTDGTVRFTGHIDKPIVARINAGGQHGPIFFLEPGDISISSDGITQGTPLNEKMAADRALMEQLSARYRTLDQNDSLQSVEARHIVADYDSIPVKAYRDNRDNPYGLFMFVQMAYEMPLRELRTEMTANPALARSAQLKGIVNLKTARASSAEGSRYKDFTVVYNDSTQTLSSLVMPGRYTLVDYWASWCGPCMTQLKVLKDLYSRFHDRGLDVVGVAVWDRPEDTLAAIKAHDITWPTIIDAQTIPTDLYGIQGIPCIMLIGPDGVIISRDKQGRELVEIVEKSMADHATITSMQENYQPLPEQKPATSADTIPAF